MLSPLSGLQAAIKRRNSKARRDSFSLSPSSLPVPGEGGIRRFSSSETLNGSYLLGPAPSVVTVTRRSSISRRIRKVSSGSNHHQQDTPDPCCLLDLHIAQIKRKLADFREEDVEMSERVEELTNCLSDLCHDYHIPCSPAEEFLPEALYQLHHEATETSSGEESEEQDFLQYCETHSNMHQSTNTLPLPRRQPPPPPTVTPPTNRSLSHEGFRKGSWSHTLSSSATTSHLPSHYPHHHGNSLYLSCPESSLRPRPVSYHAGYHHRPLSYREISYDENDFEEGNLLGVEDANWAELSCP